MTKETLKLCEDNILGEFFNHSNKPIPSPIDIESVVPSKIKSKPSIEPEDIAKHQSLLLLIGRYSSSERFGPFSKTLNFKLDHNTLHKKSIDELTDLLKRIRVTINSKGSSNFLLGMVKTTIAGVEKITTSIPKIKDKFDLTGFSEIVNNDPGFADLIEQI